MIYIEEKLPIKVPGETSFFIKFNSSPLLEDIINQCTPINYDKKTNLWEIPITRLSKFINQASIFDEITLTILKNKKEKVVVFSLFKEPLNQLYNKLTKYKPLLCTGDVSDIDISKNINLFQTNSEYKVILCTHSKMGTGVTLNAASYSIFIDSPWTAGMSEQSEDRIHRIGSKKPVFIYKLYCNNTFDMRVKEIVENKQALGDYLIDNKRDQKTLEVLKKLLTKENLY